MPSSPLITRGLVAPFAGVFLRRSVAYWVLVHVALALLVAAWAALAGRPVPLAALLPGGNPLAPLLVLGMGMLEARRRDEDLFLANLGYGRPTIAVWAAVPAAALEVAFTFARPALAESLGLPAVAAAMGTG